MLRTFTCRLALVVAGITLPGGVLAQGAIDLGERQPELRAAGSSPREKVPAADVPQAVPPLVRPVLSWTTPTSRQLEEQPAALEPRTREPLWLGGQWVEPTLNADRRPATEESAHAAMRWDGAAAPEWTEERIKPSRASGYDEVWDNRLVKKYRDAPVAQVDLFRALRAQAVEQLSLADINRYQFRRNRSDEPGLPVQQAGAQP